MIGKLAAFLLIPLYTARLSRAEYGSYGLALTLHALAGPIVTAALSSALARFYFDYTDPTKRREALGAIASAIVAMALVSAIAATIVYWICGNPDIAGLSPVQIRIVIWTCACIPIAEIPILLLRASERAGLFAAVHLTGAALTAGSTAYLMLVCNAGLTGMLSGVLIGQAATALFALAYIVFALQPSWDSALLRSALVYSLPFIPHALANSLMVSVDRWALELHGLREDIGLLTLASQLTMPISLATSAWNDASSPRFLAIWRDGGDEAARAALPRIVFGFVATGGAVLVAITIGIPIFRYFVGARFQSAFPIVPWLGLGLVVGATFSAFVNVLSLRKTTAIIPVLTLTAVAANAALNLALVPRFGVWGAVAATGFAYALRTALLARASLRAFRTSRS